MGDATLTFGDAHFDTEVLQSETPVLVDFWASWCGPCLAIAPIIDEIAGEQQGSLKVGKLDVDANGGTAMRYNVFSIPTLILFKDGQEVERIVGGMPKERMMAKLRPHLPAVG